MRALATLALAVADVVQAAPAGAAPLGIGCGCTATDNPRRDVDLVACPAGPPPAPAQPAWDAVVRCA